jgi:hypothetical protein
MTMALVCGAGGFIGSHLVNRLKSEGFWVRGVDLKFPGRNSDNRLIRAKLGWAPSQPLVAGLEITSWIERQLGSNRRR